MFREMLEDIDPNDWWRVDENRVSKKLQTSAAKITQQFYLIEFILLFSFLLCICFGQIYVDNFKKSIKEEFIYTMNKKQSKN